MSRISKDIDKALSDEQSDLKEKGYETGETKSIDFIKADGTRQMFPYSQLISAWTEQTDEAQVIKLFFSTHLVTLSGYNLGLIYDHVRDQVLKLLMARDERYLNTAKEKQPYVTAIVIEWKKVNDQD